MIWSIIEWILCTILQKAPCMMFVRHSLIRWRHLNYWRPAYGLHSNHGLIIWTLSYQCWTRSFGWSRSCEHLIVPILFYLCYICAGLWCTVKGLHSLSHLGQDKTRQDETGGHLPNCQDPHKTTCLRSHCSGNFRKNLVKNRDMRKLTVLPRKNIA